MQGDDQPLDVVIVVIVVIVEEALQHRDDLAAGAKQELLHIVVIRCTVGDENAGVVEGAVGNEHMEVQVQRQATQPRPSPFIWSRVA
jgi:hypothetical protein